MKKKYLYTLNIIMIFIFSINIYAESNKTISNLFLVNNSINADSQLIEENANLLGTVNIKLSNESTIYGNHDLKNIQYEKLVFKQVHNKFRVIPILINLLSSIFVGLLIYILFKQYFNNCSNIVSTNVGKYLLNGLLIFIIYIL